MSDNTSAAPSGTMTDWPAGVAHAYRFLLQHPGASLADFAEYLEVSADAARAVLDQLSTVALVEEQKSALVAVSPMRAMQKLLVREHAHLAERQRRLLESFETLALVLPSYRGTRSPSTHNACWEELPDLPTIRHRLEELALGARLEVLSLLPPAHDAATSGSASRALDLSVLRRGVSIRTVYPENLSDDIPTQQHIAELTAAGAVVRFACDLPLRMVIVDQRHAVVPMDPADSAKGALVTWHPGVVAGLLALFEACWRTGRELGASECSPLERLILNRLMAGAKDEAIARHLGLSVRTVRRGIAMMMARLGVTSRFELGGIAAQRRWI